MRESASTDLREPRGAIPWGHPARNTVSYTIFGPGAGPSAVLREDEHGVRPDGERAVERHLVISSRHSVAVAAEGPTEQAAVPLPVAVEAQPPPPAARQADDVVVVAAVAEIGDHDDVIARPPAPSGGRPGPGHPR